MKADTAHEERWSEALTAGDSETAWNLFIDQYRRLIFAAIRHYAHDHDEVMDAFAEVCGALRRDNLAKLRKYWDRPTHTARFSTWLVTVVRHQVIDWMRRHSSHQGPHIVESLSLSDTEVYINLGADEAPDPAVLADTRRRIKSALNSLEPDERLAVELFVVHGMPAATLAKVMRWPNAKAVYNRVYRALAAVRAHLNGQGIRREDL